MVYKIRNKSFFWTRGGWKNNHNPKHFNIPRPNHPELTMAIRTRIDHHSFLRANQAYRNLSRYAKQYFYGDKKLEEVFILAIKDVFHAPFYSETLTHLIKHGGERRLVDQLDRDVEIASYNYHPFQLFTYEVYNRNLAIENENYETKKSGQKTLADEMQEYTDHIIAEEEAKLPEGEKLSTDKTADIILHAIRKARAGIQRPATDSRGPDGNINDYLEQRRPFIAPTPDLHTH
jgi:hypothetical protein